MGERVEAYYRRKKRIKDLKVYRKWYSEWVWWENAEYLEEHFKYGSSRLRWYFQLIRDD